MKIRLVFLSLSFFVVFGINGQETRKLFALAGQSNAAGMGTLDGSPIVTIGTSNGTCYEYLVETDEIVTRDQDPIGENVGVGTGIPNDYFTRAQTYGAWPSFVKKYMELWKQKSHQNMDIYLVQTAKGGSGCAASSFFGTDYSFNTWSSSDLLFFKSVEKINGAIKKTCMPLSGVIWLQGESDAAAIRRNAITKEEYKQALLDLIARYRQVYGPTLKFYIIKTANGYLPRSNCPEPCAYNATNYYYCCLPNNPNDGYTQAKEVQEEVAANDPNTFIVYNHPDATSSTIPNSTQLEYYKDGTHYRKSTYDFVGKQIAYKIFQLENTNFIK